MKSELVWEDVAQPDLELIHQGFELVEGEVVFSSLKAILSRSTTQSDQRIKRASIT
jgi:hypothetical protein